MRAIVFFAIRNQTPDAKGAAVNAFGLTGCVTLAAIGLGCAVAVAAGAGAGYDGVYRGATTLDRGADPPCGKVTYPMSVTVVGSIAFDAVTTPFGERVKMLGGSAVHFALAVTAARFQFDADVSLNR